VKYLWQMYISAPTGYSLPKLRENPNHGLKGLGTIMVVELKLT